MPYKDKEKQKEHSKEYYKTHKKEQGERCKKYYQENKVGILNCRKDHYQKNREKILKHVKKYQETHKEQGRKYMRKYKELHKEQLLEYCREWWKGRRKNLKYKLSGNISTAIYLSLKGNKNGRHWEDLVGYTLRKLMQHLEKQFTPEMSWENYGSYWSIDHVVPVSVFNFDNYNQLNFRRCWELKNLQPLEKIRNIKKRNKFDKSFQLNLKI